MYRTGGSRAVGVGVKTPNPMTVHPLTDSTAVVSTTATVKIITGELKLSMFVLLMPAPPQRQITELYLRDCRLFIIFALLSRLDATTK